MSRVVVTGLGVLAPNGNGTDDYWSNTLAGKSGIAPISLYDASRYPCTLAGEVPGFDAEVRVPGKLRAQTDHMTHLALAATEAALADAQADPAAFGEYEMGVVTANSSGGTVFGQRELEKLWSKGPEHVGAYMAVAWFYAATTGQISIRHKMRGPCGVLVAEQAGGLDAIGHAVRQVRREGLRLIVTGGTDASLSPAGLTAQLTTGLLSHRSDPHRAYLPFDRAAAGYVPGQGGAVLLLEDYGSAVKRGAPRLYGEIAGYAAGFDPGSRHVLPRVIVKALTAAGAGPDDVDVVFADALGDFAADRQEARALRELFGPRGVPVTAPKTMTGRLYAGGGPLDVASALLAIRDQVIPPTVNVADPVPGDELDLVLGEPRPAPVRTALVVARGFGGFCTAIVVRALP
ncbi:ketosynthase chain-length factor [Sinosporangium siamense]|uniref:Actinorhodin polyketide putative beta-ketoacyl synthase 2 n=1 Tax=Sinosporangium siamense TaxID=1367973 RepID=A0A919V948_9ACTN|nr:ketosynthase chain-length factor [Sinosporangium siamense]GII95073.1 actinorhodin polyketide putative beta-ketoacyl synthase 2 [Sinosporangium siamense]